VSYIQDLRAKIGHMRVLLPGCIVFIRNADGQILMQQRTYPRGKWGLPGGLMELEESPEDTVRREIKEETGMALGRLELFGAYSGADYLCVAQNGDEFQVVTLVYVCDDFAGAPTVMDDESLAFKWFATDELPSDIARTHQKIIADYIQYGMTWITSAPWHSVNRMPRAEIGAEHSITLRKELT